MSKMSRNEAHRLALHYAICERDSFADANHEGSPERRRALALAKEFRRVLREEFGEQTAEDAFAASRAPSVSIFETVAREPQEFKAPILSVKVKPHD